MTSTTNGSILASSMFDAGALVLTRPIELSAFAHDASHYLLMPEAVVVPESIDAVSGLFASSSRHGRQMTFRSGGTSLSGQAVSGSLLVDVRRRFRKVEVLDNGMRVRVQPGVTLRQVNARLARHGRKLGPDPASEIACTIGGVIANNSSGMTCGISQNSYRTIESMTVVLPSGTVIDTGDPSADKVLLEREPDLSAGLLELRKRILAEPTLVDEIGRQYSIKNTMGYGLNSLLDFSSASQILAHLMIGSEGTLGFVAEAVFRTVPLHSSIATGFLVFRNLEKAITALPALIDAGFAAVELLDARSLTVAQSLRDCPDELAGIKVVEHAALLVEMQAPNADRLAASIDLGKHTISTLDLVQPATLSSDAVSHDRLWKTRKGLYPAIAGARPSGTTALLEDVSVPIDRLAQTCRGLDELFQTFGYENAVIFGHARDGNIHFMITEDFSDGVERYRDFTTEMVQLVLANGGSLKAEHGTGRVMAPFVRDQFGDALYAVMHRIKDLFDPEGLLNPGVLLSDRADSYLDDLKVLPTVDAEVDRCVECGYCEPVCPSKDLTLTPRQRIVLRREVSAARARGDDAFAEELEKDYEYEGVETCAVDGMCAIACPVGINTGDLVRRLRADSRGPIHRAIGRGASHAWGPITIAAAAALTVTNALPGAVTIGVTRVGRQILGDDDVPLYDSGLPRGGRRRRAEKVSEADFVYFPGCVATMFGPEGVGDGVRTAFEELCRRAGVVLRVPAGINGLCCGTPWKSKGYLDGYARMTEAVLPALVEASEGGRLPIVCDAASCTEGLETMRDLAKRQGHKQLQFVDSVELVYDRLASKLKVTERLDSIVLHHTCSTASLGVNNKLTALASLVADEVMVPLDEGCCAFAGDRGMLHPELTASATAAEAAEVARFGATAYVSANRTCEIGMSRATGQTYRHVLEIVEEATRPIG
jgi:D-lactate dehydrogenase